METSIMRNQCFSRHHPNGQKQNQWTCWETPLVAHVTSNPIVLPICPFGCPDWTLFCLWLCKFVYFVAISASLFFRLYYSLGVYAWWLILYLIPLGTPVVNGDIMVIFSQCVTILQQMFADCSLGISINYSTQPYCAYTLYRKQVQVLIQTCRLNLSSRHVEFTTHLHLEVET